VIIQPGAILAVLLTVLALLFATNRTELGRKVFRWVPLLVFAYFVPTALSNTGLIPLQSPLYDFIKKWLLPASLVLLTLSIDLKAIFGLGRNALILFLTGTFSIALLGPLVYLALQGLAPAELGDQAWKGLAALSGSWIGGGANFVAIGESVGASDGTMAMMVVVDVSVASVWMAILLGFSGRSGAMDAKIGADSGSIDRLRDKVERFQKKIAKPTDLASLLTMLAFAFGATAVAHGLSTVLPPVGDIIGPFTWVVLIATTLGVAASFTPLRRLEGSGASAMGSVFLYLLVATIGAKADFAKVFDVPGLLVIGAVWMSLHATVMLLMRRWLRAPIFFAAVGSQANVGGAASAPIVAGAFHQSLAPVGVVLAIGGYALGTYAGLLCATLLELVYG